MAATLVPPWLEQLLSTSFFLTCRSHGDAARSECNMFCVDCPSAAAFCFYCRNSSHSDHRTIQIRRSSYHDVVRVSETQKLLDLSGIQTYVINSARVLFLNERPQPRGGSSGASSSAAASSIPGKTGGGAPHLCEICNRTLLDPFRFCSLGCKLERIKRVGDACFVVDEGDAIDSDQQGSTKVSVTDDERRRRRRRASTGGELSSSASATPSEPVRRRKGVPHRAPFGS